MSPPALPARAFSQANQELTGTLQSLQVEGLVALWKVPCVTGNLSKARFFRALWHHLQGRSAAARAPVPQGSYVLASGETVLSAPAKAAIGTATPYKHSERPIQLMTNHTHGKLNHPNYRQITTFLHVPGFLELAGKRLSRRYLHELRRVAVTYTVFCMHLPCRCFSGFEPFFVPRAPLLVEDDIELEILGVMGMWSRFTAACRLGPGHKMLARLAELFAYLGCQIFESSPGRGLAPWPTCRTPATTWHMASVGESPRLSWSSLALCGTIQSTWWVSCAPPTSATFKSERSWARREKPTISSAA